VYFVIHNVVEHPNFPDTEPVLWPTDAPKAFDSALADLARFVTEVPLDSITHFRSDTSRFEALKIFGCLGAKMMSNANSGQMVARFDTEHKLRSWAAAYAIFRSFFSTACGRLTRTK
jgi:hypothetical protein